MAGNYGPCHISVTNQGDFPYSFDGHVDSTRDVERVQGSHGQRVDFRRTASNSFAACRSIAIRSCVRSSHRGFLSSLRIIIESLSKLPPFFLRDEKNIEAVWQESFLMWFHLSRNV